MSYMSDKYETFECGCVRVRKCAEHDVTALREEYERLKANELAAQDEEASPEVHAARMINHGYSYDAEAGIWWKDDSKPGIVRQLEKRVAELEAALGKGAGSD